MCGIIGSRGRVITRDAVERILYRGRDGFGVNERVCDSFDPSLLPAQGVVHLLHAMVGKVCQPFEGSFVTNCEIYNWEELKEKYDVPGENDAQVFYELLKKKGIHIVDEIDGDFAFIWNTPDALIFGRDRLGVKPLCYSLNDDGILVASELKCLDNSDRKEFCEPGVVYAYDTQLVKKKDKTALIAKKEDVAQALLDAIKKRVDGLTKVGILFSGGVDSTLLAKVCKDLGKQVHLYTAGFCDGNLEEARDVIWAKKAASTLGIPLCVINADFEETESAIKEIIPVIESDDIVKVGVALPFHFCAKKAHEDGVRVLLSGIGAEECFAGYERHLKVLESGGDVNEECRRGFEEIWKRDLYRDDVITMYHSVELRVPFLDENLVRISLGIPQEEKISRDQKKIILRKIAAELGVPKEVCERKKLGAQYGSKFDRAIEKLAKRQGMQKQEFLRKISASLSKKELSGMSNQC